MIERKKLNLGHSDFKNIIQSNSYFVDKSLFIKEIIDIETSVVLFPRPRRFGKSLFLDTLKDLFEGKQSLFEGLSIHDQWDWKSTSPVIRISFGAGVHDDVAGLDVTIKQILQSNAKRLGISCEETDDAKIPIRTINRSYL